MEIKQRNNFTSLLDYVAYYSGMSKEKLIRDDQIYKMKFLDRLYFMICEAFKKNLTIYIVGDYDVDGICSSSILYITLCIIKNQMHSSSKIIVVHPGRFTDGYGMNIRIVSEMEDNSFILTCDNGIAAMDAIDFAKSKGITVAVTDHHEPVRVNGAIKLPNADLIIDPYAIPDSADFQHYCGAGIAYKFAEAVFGINHRLLRPLRSLAMLATYADSVPLTYDNRKIVIQGEKDICCPEGMTKGLKALMEVLGFVNDYHITTYDVQFRIAPTMNAAGRLMDHGSMLVFELLTWAGSYEEAVKKAAKLKELNDQRKALSSKWCQICDEYITTNHLTGTVPLVVRLKDCPDGIIGLIAGDVAERYQTPVIILTDQEDENELKGSARSYGDVDLKALLDNNVADLLSKYGGHAGAAGLRLPKENFDEFYNRLKEAMKHIDIKLPNPDIVEIDIAVKPEMVPQFAEEWEIARPFGAGNPEPIAMITGAEPKIIKDNKAYVKIGSAATAQGVKLDCKYFNALSFNCFETYPYDENVEKLILIGKISYNYYKGWKTPQILFTNFKAFVSESKKTDLAEKLSNAASQRNGGKIYA